MRDPARGRSAGRQSLFDALVSTKDEMSRDRQHAGTLLAPSAGHLLEEPGTLEAVARLAATSLRRTLADGDSSLAVPG
jgi:hypothetical protein